MEARTPQMLLCMLFAVLLVTPFCNAARTFRPADDPEVPMISSIDEEAPIFASEKDIGFNQWARFQVQEVAVEDYTPPKRTSRWKSISTDQ